ncbi:MAG: nuclear transport factor 2 family protein [Bacteroidales bacterium]|nr:nuclear transport factor 2 family protein [Bacteroidales bacterium]
MRSGKTLIVCALLALTSTACQPPAQEAGPLSDYDIGAIEDIIQKYVQAMLTKDLNAWTGLWTEDAVMMPPNSPALEGREAIIQDLMAGPAPTEFVLDVLDIDGAGDVAYVRGTYSITMTVAGVPEPVRYNGNYLSIFKKQPDATWLFAVDTWN